MGNQSLIADLVGWVSKQPRPYGEVMDAWRTSCPRLSIWEDAVDLGLLERRSSAGTTSMIYVTDKGIEFLGEVGRLESS